MNAPRFRIPHLNEEQVMHAMTIDDAYRVERVLAEGCAGVTECVTIDGVGPFVRKRIPSKLANRGVWAALAECSNPRLPQMAATYEMPDQFIAVYDFVPGDTLVHVVASCGCLKAADAVRMVREIAEAISDLHAHGIVHCDLAPSNIVLAADGAHLIDFGIAQLTGRGMTADSVPLGTWGFAAPEQYGFAPVDERTDVFSLARILGYALCGTMPDDEAFSARLTDGGVVSPELRSVVERGSAFEPSARYQSSTALAEAAESALRGEMSDAGATLSAVPGASPMPSVPFVPAAVSSASEGRSSKTLRKTMRAVLAGVVAASCVALVVVLAVPRIQNVLGGVFPTSAASFDERSKGISEESISPGSASNAGTSSAAAGDRAATDESLLLEAYEALSLVETGWTVDSSGYIHYGFGLRNGNAALTIMLPAVTITGYDEKGAVLFSEDQVLRSIYPGQTTYFGFSVGSGTAPASVEFGIKRLADYNIERNVVDPATLQVSNASAMDGGELGVKFTGEVALMGEKHLGSDMGAALTVILRDAEGSIVFGNTSFVYGLAEGESTPFEVPCFAVPDYATYEIHAQPW